MTLDGQWLGRDGRWHGRADGETITPTKRGYFVTVDGFSAALVIARLAPGALSSATRPRL